MTDSELLAKATSFRIWGLDETCSYDMLVEWRGGDRWAVCRDGRDCYSRKVGWFVFESMPSSRTDEFLADTRFSRDEAIKIASEIGARYQVAWDEWVAGGRQGYFCPQFGPHPV